MRLTKGGTKTADIRTVATARKFIIESDITGDRLMKLDQWAIKHNISPAALAELRALMTDTTDIIHPVSDGLNETELQRKLRQDASLVGWRLWRNNVGAGKLIDEKRNTTSYIRFGLANDSPAVNHSIKSSDLIGIKPVLIQPWDVGKTFGQFVCREVKRPGWRYAGTPREIAQLKWIEMINGMGGDAAFSTGEL